MSVPPPPETGMWTENQVAPAGMLAQKVCGPFWGLAAQSPVNTWLSQR